MSVLAHLYTHQGRYEEAEPLYLEAFETRKQVLGPDDARTRKAVSNLAALYDAWNKPDQAAEWRAKLPPEE